MTTTKHIHDTKTLFSNHLHFQKGGSQPVVYCFSGTVEWCTKPGCVYEKFFGDNSRYVTNCTVLNGKDSLENSLK